MKKISLVVNYHLKNNMFNLSDSTINRDNALYSMWLLKQSLSDSGYDISTCDINSVEESQFCFYFDITSRIKLDPSKINYLFLFESELIRPKGWNTDIHSGFHRIFTWDDTLVDNVKYFKFNYTHLFPDADTYNSTLPFENKKLCTLISANKIVNHEFELYSERVNSIKWFEANAPHDFDLYGKGWSKTVSKNKMLKKTIKIMPFLNRFGYKYSSYKGSVDSKFTTLMNYKFAICYENGRELPGYITEKIFDCFFAGCVPVYWGAPNVTDHIPADCFIDRRDFNSTAEVYEFITNISAQEHAKYIENINQFLSSDFSDQYKADSFANLITKCVLLDGK